MASHVIGSFLTASRPLTQSGRGLLAQSETWTFALLDDITIYTVRKRSPSTLTVKKPAPTMTVRKGPPSA